MKTERIFSSALLTCVLLISACGESATATPPDTTTTVPPTPNPPSGTWIVPAGFEVSNFADGITNPRSMALSSSGTVFVGSLSAGRVYALVDRDNDQRADRTIVIAQGLGQPNGIAFRNGALYVATASQLLRYDDIENRLDSPPTPVVVRAGLPNPNAGHSWKFIAFGPDDLLYMSIGSTCNVCQPAAMTAAILRMRPDGSNLEVFADGIRNSVGFDWHPATGELWFTENGRDGMGDETPDDELNVAWRTGMNFGFPFCHQGDVADPQFGAQRACSTAEAPVQRLGPHVAAIGMAFYTGSMFPANFRNAAIIAQHGSWDRSRPSGYRVMAAHTDGRRVTAYTSLLEGFLPGGSAAAGGRGAAAAANGRPADVLQMSDGALLVSDDAGNRILRVSYRR